MSERVKAELDLVMAKLLRERAALDLQIADCLEKLAAQKINAGEGHEASKGDDAPRVTQPTLPGDKSPCGASDPIAGEPGGEAGSDPAPQPDHRYEGARHEGPGGDEVPHSDPAPFKSTGTPTERLQQCADELKRRGIRDVKF